MASKSKSTAPSCACVGRDVCPVDYLPEDRRALFMSSVRPDGRVGTRYDIGIFSSVYCSATAINKIVEWFTPERLAAYTNVDDVIAFAHTSGCGISSPSYHVHVLRRTIAGYARHPNLAATLIVELDCERNRVADLVSSQALDEGRPMRTMLMQDTGSTCRTTEAGIAMVKEMLPAASAVEPWPVAASHIKIGLECGSSGGFSGISVNAALGAAMDILVRHSGTAILSETPEIHGVESMLTGRVVSPEVRQKLLDRLESWKEYTKGQSARFNGVVRQGNQQGGLANVVENRSARP